MSRTTATTPSAQHPVGRSRRAVGVTLVTAALLSAGLLACGDDDTASGDATTTTPSDGSDGSEGSTTTTATRGDEPVIDPGDGGVYAVDIDPADFVSEIDNPYWPLPIGATWVYEGEVDGEYERIEVTVLDEERTGAHHRRRRPDGARRARRRLLTSVVPETIDGGLDR